MGKVVTHAHMTSRTVKTTFFNKNQIKICDFQTFKKNVWEFIIEITILITVKNFAQVFEVI